MSVSSSESLSVSADNSRGFAGTSGDVGALAQTINQGYAAGTTDALYTISFATAALQKIWLKSDQDMTIKVNSSSAPSQTINLKAGRPYRWSVSEGYFSNPIVANVTALYITCTTSAQLQGIVLTS